MDQYVVEKINEDFKVSKNGRFELVSTSLKICTCGKMIGKGYPCVHYLKALAKIDELNYERIFECIHPHWHRNDSLKSIKVCGDVNELLTYKSLLDDFKEESK